QSDAAAVKRSPALKAKAKHSVGAPKPPSVTRRKEELLKADAAATSLRSPRNKGERQADSTALPATRDLKGAPA
ncbi:unnamed protein product, partial [Amoebophrya sp. A25]